MADQRADDSAFIIAQLSDVHIGGVWGDSAERLDTTIDALNAMARKPDLVLLTGDLTDRATPAEWDELVDHLERLDAPWEAILGNHDHGLPDAAADRPRAVELAGHRTLDAGPLRLLLLDSSAEVFTEGDARWLDSALADDPGRPTVVAIHHPPFDTGIWWMDLLGMTGQDRFEAIVRRHPHVGLVVSGHLHRPIVSSWGPTTLWVAPSTAHAIAADLDPQHQPAESAEPPMISLHRYCGGRFVSHVLPVGATAQRQVIEERLAGFDAWVRAEGVRRSGG